MKYCLLCIAGTMALHLGPGGPTSICSPTPDTREPLPPSAARPFSDAFALGGGQHFLVDGPMSFNGKGIVWRCGPETLSFGMAMPETRIFGSKIPAVEARFDLSRLSADSVSISAVVNGTVLNDPAGRLTWNGDRAQIQTDLVGPGFSISDISFQARGTRGVSLRLKLNGTTRSFILTPDDESSN